MPIPLTRPSRAAALLLVAASLALAACHDSSAPQPEVNVTVHLNDLRGPVFGSDTAGHPTITCEIDLSATATGNVSAKWVDGTYYYFDGTKRTTPRDVFTMKASDIIDAWSADSIAPGQTERSSWSVTSGIPFAGEIDFGYYRDLNAQPKQAKVAFTCGPEVSESTPFPTIDSVAMVPPSGNLPPGAPLTVSYAASAESGVWQSLVQVTGPCVYHVLAFDALKTSVSHVVSVPMPTTCSQGVPIYLTVAVEDAAAQGVQRVTQTSVVVGDRAPLGGLLLTASHQPALGAVTLRDASAGAWPFTLERGRPAAPRPLTVRRIR